MADSQLILTPDERATFQKGLARFPGGVAKVDASSPKTEGGAT
ncbi:MAG TPA: hypothetical protein VGW35_09085 [Methylomirabilota bacterium]|jgi:hypothetical protein|nr:hypothetical protein [Methylomirabilota bacterium]